MTMGFVSYAHADVVLAETLRDTLGLHGYEIWMDSSEIKAGTVWELEINRAIHQSDFILIVVTPESVRSNWVGREVDIARSARKLIIPLLMRPLTDVSELELLNIHDLQYIDFPRLGFKSATDHLLNELPSVVKVTGRALVIEDVPETQLIYRQVLESMSLETIIAPDAQTAFQLIRSQHFDLITLDMQLDDLDVEGKRGVMLLDQLRIYQRDTPVIIITGLDWKPSDVRDFFKEFGAFDFLPKSEFRPDKLRHAVNKALKGS